MICICDHRTPCEVLESLKKHGFETILLPPDPSLPKPVCGHSDLLVFIHDGSLLTRRSYYEIAQKEIDLICKNAELDLILSDEKSCLNYPGDCGLCVAISGSTVICREASTDRALLSLALNKGYTILNVPQGYTKCSCAILADGALITADRGIAKVTQSAGIDTLLIVPGYVDLPGYNCGFIGGASGLCGNTLYFCGNIERHPDHAKIVEFAQKHNTDIVSLSDGNLYDVGSLIFI